MKFKEAYELKIGDHVEKKGKFSYLSWCYAVRFLRENFPGATWIAHENENGLPIFSVGNGHLVKVSVLLDGQTFTQWHPVLNAQNKPILDPSAFDINTSIHRALTKAIGIATGIGLGLYAGEDLPKEDGEAGKEQQRGAADSSGVDKLTAWLDALLGPNKKDGGKPFTVEFVKGWYENQPEVLAIKASLDANGLSSVNKYYQQVIDALRQKTQQTEGSAK